MGKVIKLNKDMEATIDSDDYEFIKNYNWFVMIKSNTAYAATTIGKKIIKMHHMIIGRPIFGFVTDHIDGNGLNNTRSNLRIVTVRENAHNLKIRRTSQYPGVYWHKLTSKWAATIWLNGRHKHLGLFSKESEAAHVFKEAMRAL